MYALKYTAVGKTLLAPQIIPLVAMALPFGFKLYVVYIKKVLELAPFVIIWKR